MIHCYLFVSTETCLRQVTFLYKKLLSRHHPDCDEISRASKKVLIMTREDRLSCISPIRYHDFRGTLLPSFLLVPGLPHVLDGLDDLALSKKPKSFSTAKGSSACQSFLLWALPFCHFLSADGKQIKNLYPFAFEFSMDLLLCLPMGFLWTLPSCRSRITQLFDVWIIAPLKI